MGNLIGFKLINTAITTEPEILVYIYTNKFDLFYDYIISTTIGASVTAVPQMLLVEVDHQYELIVELYELPFVSDD